MTSDIDIWRSAQQMVDQFGEFAPIECAIRADDFLDKGDFEGEALWRKIMAAAEHLLEEVPKGEAH